MAVIVCWVLICTLVGRAAEVKWTGGGGDDSKADRRAHAAANRPDAVLGDDPRRQCRLGRRRRQSEDSLWRRPLHRVGRGSDGQRIRRAHRPGLAERVTAGQQSAVVTVAPSV